MPKVRIGNGLKNRLRGAVRANRRATIYKILKSRHNGVVPCFVCGEHVEYEKATLEHVVPQSKGGSDAMHNLSISHFRCNVNRGNTEFREKGKAA